MKKASQLYFVLFLNSREEFFLKPYKAFMAVAHFTAGGLKEYLKLH